MIRGRAGGQMRVLHVIPSLAVRDGGPAKAEVEECRELLRRGHDAAIYTTDVDGRGRLDVPLRRPVEVEGVNVTYFATSVDHYYKYSSAMAAALNGDVRKYDLVHINSLYQFPSTAAAYYCRKHGVPYILRPHGALGPSLFRRHALRKRLYELLIEQRNLDAAAATHFTSAEEMRLAESSGLRFRGVVVPLGVDVEDRLTGWGSAADELWPELRGNKVLLFLSRINFVKGLDILAPAFAEIYRRHADARLVIAGPDNDGYGARVRGWLAGSGALRATTFTGMVSGERKAALLGRADMFLLPSYSESFGIVVVEAMAAGLPMVISNRVNIWREIDAARAALVVNPDAREVAKAISTLLDSPALGKEMGARGRRLARERFSWSGAGDQLVGLYREIVGGRLPASQPAFSRPTVGGRSA